MFFAWSPVEECKRSLTYQAISKDRYSSTINRERERERERGGKRVG